MPKKIINCFDPFMPVKLNSKSSIAEITDFTEPADFANSNINLNANFRTPSIKNGLTIMISKNSIGIKNGLGEKLLKDFICSLSTSLYLPQNLIFVNEAIYLLDDEITIETICKLKKAGVQSFVSSESIEYFKHKINTTAVTKITSDNITEKILFSKQLINI